MSTGRTPPSDHPTARISLLPGSEVFAICDLEEFDHLVEELGRDAA